MKKCASHRTRHWIVFSSDVKMAVIIHECALRLGFFFLTLRAIFVSVESLARRTVGDSHLLQVQLIN